MPTCNQCKQLFEIRPDEKSFHSKFDVPAPKNCPECRLIRRLQERNARKLYYRKCDFSGKKIISTYHEKHKKMGRVFSY